MDVLWAYLPYLLSAALMTIKLSLVCIILSNLLGLILGALAFTGPRWLDSIITVYVFSIRGVPVLVLMFLSYFGLSALGWHIDGVLAVGGALIIYSTTYVTDTVRSSLRTVSPGEVEGGKSIGLRWWQLLWHVQLPHATRVAIAPLTNYAIITVKGTSYASIVGVWELTYASREVVESTFSGLQIFSAVMVIYFLICYPIALLSRWFQKRISFPS